MAPIIGFTGFARAGKSTAAQYLVEEHGFTELSFAKALKDMAYAVNPIVTTRVWCPVRLQEVVDELGWEKAKDEYSEVRSFLQRLGTEGVRGHLGEDAWVDVVEGELDDLWSIDLFEGQPLMPRNPRLSRRRPIVIADVRFENEANFIRRANGLVFRIDRTHHKKAVSAHASEMPVSAESVITNIDGDPAAMRADLDALVEALK